MTQSILSGIRWVYRSHVAVYCVNKTLGMYYGVFRMNRFLSFALMIANSKIWCNTKKENTFRIK